MLVEVGRGQPDRGGRLGEVRRKGDGAHALRVVDRIQLERLGERERLADRLYRAGGHAGGEQRLAPLRPRARAEAALELRAPAVAGCDPALVRHEALVTGEAGSPERLREPGELRVVAGEDH